MYGTARRDLVFFQRGAGYASGLNPYQEGGSKRRQKTLHEMYCSKPLHAPRSSGKKTKRGKRDKQQTDAVVLRRSSRVRKTENARKWKERQAEGRIRRISGWAGNCRSERIGGLGCWRTAKRHWWSCKSAWKGEEKKPTLQIS